MRAMIVLAVLALAAPAFADDVERPRQIGPRPAPSYEALRAPLNPGESETVTLSDSFFAETTGGVAADVGPAAPVYSDRDWRRAPFPWAPFPGGGSGLGWDRDRGPRR